MKAHCNTHEFVPNNVDETEKTLMTTASTADTFLYHLNEELDRLEMILFGLAVPEDLKENQEQDITPMACNLEALIEDVESNSEKCYERLYNIIDRIG